MKTILSTSAFGRMVGLIFSFFFAVVCARADFQFTTIAGPPRLKEAESVAVDGSGNVYVGEGNYHVILKITPSGTVSTFAGLEGSPGFQDGTGTAARFTNPSGVAVDGAGNVYVADRNNSAIRKITPAGEVTTLAGGVTSSLQYPSGVAVDAVGYVYVLDYGAIRKISPAGVVSTVANLGGDGIAVSDDGTVYVTYSNAILKVSSTGIVTTLAGLPVDAVGYVNGPGASARFDHPAGLAVDHSGNVYVVEIFNFTIRKIAPDGTVSAVAGQPGGSGNVDGSPTVVRFRTPLGLALDNAGNIYVADAGNSSIRKGIRAPTIMAQPASQAVAAGALVTFSVSVVDDESPVSFQWRKGGAAIAGATTSTYTIPSVTQGDAGDYSVLVTDPYGSVTSDNAVLVVGQSQVAPVILTQPQSSAVFVGYPVTLTVAAIGTPAPTYQWQKNGINIAGATDTTLTLNTNQVTDAGSYALVVTNSAGSVTSRFARVVVLVQRANSIMYDLKAYPTEVTPGGNVNLEYVLTNTGIGNWGSNHYLSIRDSHDTFMAFSSLLGTNAGESKTVNTNFPAPASPGTYTYTVQAYQGGVEFFPTLVTFTLTVVAPAGNSITYNATNFPITATPGSNLIFSYNVTNTGTKTWGTNHFLSLRDGAGVYAQFSSLNGVASGQSKTVNLSFTAPATPGVYPYYVQAEENGVEFFTAQANLTLMVLAPQPNAVAYTKTRSQDNVTPGATVSLRYSFGNTGTGTWGASHYASLRDNSGNFLAFVPLNGVTPGGSTTVNFSFAAPTTPGSYSYFVQAYEDGVEFFDKQDLVTLNVLALPIANAATYNTTNFPTTAARSAMVNFTHNVTNRGTKTWGTNHYLSLRDADSSFLGFPSLNGIAPGQSTTVNYRFTAPATPGVYTYHVQGFEGSVEFFNEADDLVLIVP